MKRCWILSNRHIRCEVTADRKGCKSLLLSVINKNVKDFLLQSGTEIYLFGEDLGEEIRTARSVKRSGQELRWLKQKGSLQSEADAKKRGGRHPEHQQQSGPGRARGVNLNANEPTARAAARAALDLSVCPFVIFVIPLLVFSGLDLNSTFFTGGSEFTAFSVFGCTADIIL
ncbi:hypothetical protein SFRURICE_009426 [Spodoptera frugiperda]|nr:hypothetical protein SFRURICE_009426 [Spodoptera frugiperda]